MKEFFSNFVQILVFFAISMLVAAVDAVVAGLISGDFDGFLFYVLVLVLFALKSAAMFTFC